MGIKKIAFLVPRPGMDLHAFWQYWRHTHGPLVSTSPGYGMWRLYYAQNHPIRAGPIGKPFAYAGMAVFVLPGQSSNEDSFSETAIYRDRINIDERKFIDMSRTVSFGAKALVVVDGHGPVKLVILETKPLEVDSGIFQRIVYESANAVAGVLETHGMVGWVVNFAIPGTSRLPGSRTEASVRIDVVHEIWFQHRSLPDSKSIYDILESSFKKRLHSEDAFYSSFVAKEIVFFDHSSKKMNS